MMSGAIPDPAHKNGDTAARDLLVENNLGFIRKGAYAAFMTDNGVCAGDVLPQLRELKIGS